MIRVRKYQAHVLARKVVKNEALHAGDFRVARVTEVRILGVLVYRKVSETRP